MEIKPDTGGDDDEVVLKPDPVVKADPADFVVSDNVTPAMLSVTLEELLRAVDTLDRFETHDTAQQVKIYVDFFFLIF